MTNACNPYTCYALALCTISSQKIDCIASAEITTKKFHGKRINEQGILDGSVVFFLKTAVERRFDCSSFC